MQRSIGERSVTVPVGLWLIYIPIIWTTTPRETKTA